MDREPARRSSRGWIPGTLMAGVLAAAIFSGSDQASGAPGGSAPSPLDTVVLTGSYSCSVYAYSLVPLPPPPPPFPAPTPDPGAAPPVEPGLDDPVLERELTHYVSILGTGAVTLPTAISPAPRRSVRGSVQGSAQASVGVPSWAHSCPRPSAWAAA